MANGQWRMLRQGQGQGQGQDHLLLQRAALPPFLVLALTLVLVLTLDLAQITKPPSAKYPSVYSRYYKGRGPKGQNLKKKKKRTPARTKGIF